MPIMRFPIPKEIKDVAAALRRAGFEAYLVGGCVRDLALGKKPKDWDITTNATPKEIQEIFPDTFYENEYGTVGVVNETVDDETLKVVEITPYRTESAYSDKRRPDTVSWAKNLSDDLARRDFTINALAYNDEKDELIDLHGGQGDLENKVVRAVGNPDERFAEDALRMMRAARIATDLDFTIDPDTESAIKNHAPKLKEISAERIREEFSRIIQSARPMQGIILLHTLSLLQYIAPEIEEGIQVEQNGDHIYDVWEHNLRALDHSAEREWPLHVRLAALFHDVSKPETRRWSDEKKDWTFYGHDVVGGKKAKKILARLKYPSDLIETVTKLVRWHLFFSDIEKITLSAVRRLVRNVGPENVWDLMKVRACDRIGMGRPKEKPYRLRKYESMIEEAARSPVSVAMLAVDGARIMELTGEPPG
ncbi:MAG: HD domain-containing protein, partial [Parcubacteria group bacterium]|nr:HD domain-containing protein [Parcubacteria group bacterium]